MIISDENKQLVKELVASTWEKPTLLNIIFNAYRKTYGKDFTDFYWSTLPSINKQPKENFDNNSFKSILAYKIIKLSKEAKIKDDSYPIPSLKQLQKYPLRDLLHMVDLEDFLSPITKFTPDEIMEESEIVDTFTLIRDGNFNLKYPNIVNTLIKTIEKNLDKNFTSDNPIVPESKKYAASLLSVRFFQTSLQNTKINLSLVAEFYENFKPELSDDLKESFNLFINLNKKLNDISNFEDEKFIKIYKDLLPYGNLQRKLYECISFAKETSAKAISSFTTNLKGIQAMSKSDLKTNFDISGTNVKILDFRDKEFKFLIETTSVDRQTDPERSSNVFRPSKDRQGAANKYDSISTSLISNDSLFTYGDLKDSLTWIYTDVNPKDILHVSERDSYTYFKREHDVVTDYRFSPYSPDQILQYCRNNRTYNEINLFCPSKNGSAHKGDINWNNTSVKFVKAILALKKPTKLELEIAETNDIPIVVISGRGYFPVGDPGKCSDEDKTYTL